MKKMTTSFHGNRYQTGFFSVLLFLLLLYGCHNNEGARKSLLPPGNSPIARIAVIPFQIIVPTDPAAKMLSCPVCSSAFQADHDTQPTGGEVLQELVLESLREQTQLVVIPPGEAAAAYKRAAGEHPEDLTKALQQTAKELGVEAVLVGYVFRYRELRGKWYSAEKPASVAFELHLLQASDGAILWNGAFDRTQASLMENLFQISFVFKWGIKWVTVKELSEEGVEQLMNTFPGRR